MNEQNMNMNQSQNQNEKIIFCSRCGASMKASSRYCMKCGNLNYEHPANTYMKQFVDGTQSNVSNVNNVQNTETASYVNDNSGSYKTCLIFNLVLCFILPVTLFILSLFTGDIRNVFSALASFVGGGILFLFMYSFQRIYIKADQPWWSIFIPFYGNYCFFKITMDSGWLFLSLLIPVVGQVVSLISIYNLGKRFGKSGLLTLLFPYVMIPIIGLEKDKIGIADRANELDEDGITKTEKEYKKNKVFKIIIILLVIGVLLYLLWPYLKIFGVWFIELLKESFNFFK